MKSKKGVFFTALAIVLAANVFTSEGAAIITFDNAGGLSQFNLNGNAATTFSFNASAGVGGGGGVRSTSTIPELAAAVYPAGSVNGLGETFFASVDFRYQIQITQIDIQLGFVSRADRYFDDAPSGNVRLCVLGSFDGSEEEFVCFVDGTVIGLPNVILTNGNWYRVRLDLTKVTSTNYSATATLDDLGSTGVAAPLSVSSRNFNFTSTTLGNAQTLFPGFTFSNQTTGTDNFSATSVVPEPVTFHMLLMGMVGLAGSRRRRSE